MNKTIKAVLLSALVFPGCGQLWLRHYKTGVGLLAASLCALSIGMNDTMGKASAIFNKILAGDIPLDPQAISEQAAAIEAGGSSALANGAMWVLAICWLLGIIDAYRITRHESR